MAYQTGNVLNFTDFIDTVKSFLITNNWVNLKDSVGAERELFFRNNDNDLVIGFKTLTDNITYHNLIFNVSNSFNNGNSFFEQSGSIPNYPENSLSNFDVSPVATLHDNAINYWFFLNDRRLIVVAKCGISYISFYLGKFLAYGSNNQYPKPFFAGSNGYKKDQLLSDTTNSNQAFLYQNNGKVRGLSVIKDENGNWIKILNSTTGTEDYGMIYPTNIDYSKYSKNTDDSYNLTPVILFTDKSAAGELDNVFVISGLGLSPENILTIDTEEYIVFNNIFRTTQSDFFAIKK